MAQLQNDKGSTSAGQACSGNVPARQAEGLSKIRGKSTKMHSPQEHPLDAEEGSLKIMFVVDKDGSSTLS